MPPFLSSKCPHCQNKNRHDCLEIRDFGQFVRAKGVPAVPSDQPREIVVTCSHCLKPYKITVPKGTCDE